MVVPFISSDRRADLLSQLASSASAEDTEATDDTEGTKSAYNKQYVKENAKDSKDTKDTKDTKDSADQGLGGGGVDDIIRAAGADAAATDEADAEVSVGNKWVKPDELERVPVV
jgi:hypothetical protein